MKHIKKTSPPPFFSSTVAGLTAWRHFSKKRSTKQHILQEEQNYLCCYCEKRVSLDNSHLEHIYPKSKYPSQTFDYNNLIVSCEGTHCNLDESTSKNICGHKKLNEFNPINFLDPTTTTDIGEYFIYNKEGEILASTKDSVKADYMINTLNLNYSGLIESRKNTVRALVNAFRRLSLNQGQQEQKLKTILANESQDFISFLRHYFNPIVS
ncbi:TIGR02646 family protein [Saprospira grandis DSM 2844]|uniref:TIGR02646 family protein n=1 Tax=Saprospira grandis DSM 2844 TaxID=694433 RepID=J0XSN1_9BACT|nr:retron system putative HNH endonuclease [Saprospira grandis]EJF51926.1 TIGR02646 family protein [Saprospira grandis DSM 2844]